MAFLYLDVKKIMNKMKNNPQTTINHTKNNN